MYFDVGKQKKTKINQTLVWIKQYIYLIVLLKLFMSLAFILVGIVNLHTSMKSFSCANMACFHY